MLLWFVTQFKFLLLQRLELQLVDLQIILYTFWLLHHLHHLLNKRLKLKQRQQFVVFKRISILNNRRNRCYCSYCSAEAAEAPFITLSMSRRPTLFPLLDSVKLLETFWYFLPVTSFCELFEPIGFLLVLFSALSSLFSQVLVIFPVHTFYDYQK